MLVICEHGGVGAVGRRCGGKSRVDKGNDASQRRVAMGVTKWWQEEQVMAVTGDDHVLRPSARWERYDRAEKVRGGGASQLSVAMGRNKNGRRKV